MIGTYKFPYSDLENIWQNWKGWQLCPPNDYTPPQYSTYPQHSKTPPLQRLHPSKDSTPPKTPPLQRFHPSKDSTPPDSTLRKTPPIPTPMFTYDALLAFGADFETFAFSSDGGTTAAPFFIDRLIRSSNMLWSLSLSCRPKIPALIQRNYH